MFEDLGDVHVLAGFVAVLLVGSVAFVGPKTRSLLGWREREGLARGDYLP